MSSCLKLNKRVDFNFNWNSIRRCFYFYFFFTFLISIGNLRQVKVFLLEQFFFHRTERDSLCLSECSEASFFLSIVWWLSKWKSFVVWLPLARLYGWMGIPASAFQLLMLNNFDFIWEQTLVVEIGKKFNFVDFFLTKRCQDWVIFENFSHFTCGNAI